MLLRSVNQGVKCTAETTNKVAVALAVVAAVVEVVVAVIISLCKTTYVFVSLCLAHLHMTRLASHLF